MRVALYTRVSSQEQAQHGVSLAEQKERLEAWAKIEGWEVAEIYTDEGYTGGNDNRPDLQRLMADARAGAFNVVAVTKIDRFFRNTRQLLNYIHDLESCGVTFVAQSEGIDTSKPGMGKVILSMLGSVAEWERDRIGQRVSDFRKHLAKKGQWSSGRTPFGYRFNKETKELVIDPLALEAEAVKFIFTTYTEKQLGIVRTAELCNKQGLITPRSGRRQHTTWNQSVIRHILTHPAYRGGPCKGWQFRCPAIVSPGLWEQAQRQLANNRHFRATENHNPFTGLLRCGLCGKTLRTGYNHTTTRVWECPGRLKVTHLDGSPRCTLPRRKADGLTRWLVKTISEIFSDPDKLKGYISDTIKNLQAERDTLERKLKPIQSNTKRIQEQMSKADTMYEMGRLPREDYRARIMGLRKRLTELEKQTTEADPLLLKQISENESQITHLQNMREWADFKVTERNREAERQKGIEKGREAAKVEIDQLPADMPEQERLDRLHEILSKQLSKQGRRPEPMFSPEALQAAAKLQGSGKGVFTASLSLFDNDGLIYVPEIDMDNPKESTMRLLRKLGMYAYIYPERIEIKGTIRQSNITSACMSGHYPRFQRREAAAERLIP